MKKGVLEGMSIDCDNNQVHLRKKEDLGVMSVDYGHTLHVLEWTEVTVTMIYDYYYNETN